MNVSIVIPAYNEANTIQALLERVMAVSLPGGLDREIIVIDDCSKDQTRQVVQQLIDTHQDVRIRLLCHDINQGKGAALHTGILHATGDLLLIQDADLEYDPDEYGLLLSPIIDGKADAVFGSRFAGGRPHRVLFFWHSVGNQFLTLLSNMFTDLNLTDMETCYKAFRTPVIKQLTLNEKRFGFEPEVTAKLARIPNIRIYEVGISYYGRTYAEGKKISWKDGFRAIYCILKYNLLAGSGKQIVTPTYPAHHELVSTGSGSL